MCTKNCDTDGDGVCDYNCYDENGNCTKECDTDGDGKCDIECDDEVVLGQLTFVDTNKLNSNALVPGWTGSKTFIVMNNSTSVVKYKISWTNIINTFTSTNNLYYGLVRNGNTLADIETARVPRNVDQGKSLVDNVSIQPGEIHTYTITYEFRNTEFNQDVDKDKTFSTKLRVDTLN